MLGSDGFMDDLPGPATNVWLSGYDVAQLWAFRGGRVSSS